MMGPKIGNLIRPALVSLGVTGILCSCSSPVRVVDAPPFPKAAALTRAAVVLPPVLRRLTLTCNATPPAGYYFFLGTEQAGPYRWCFYSKTNSVTAEILLEEDAELFGMV